MEPLLAEQKVTSRAILRALDSFKKIEKDNLTYGVVRHRLKKVKAEFARFEHCHVKLTTLATEEEITTKPYFTEDHYAIVEAAYYAAADHMADWEAQLEPRSAFNPDSSSVSPRSPAPASRSALQLPRINLPKFSGDFSEWEPFRDQFKAVIIDNSDLADVHRLYYLNSHLKGNAFEIVQNLKLVDSNFQVAWELLIERYDNKRRLVHEHIHALMSLPQMTSESAMALTALRDKANVAIKALRHLKRAVDSWDDILVYLLVQKLDWSTRKAWELQLGDTSAYPPFKSLEQFLASRTRALESIQPVNKVKPFHSSTVQSHATNTNSIKCPNCQKPHLLFSCPDFRNKTVAERREFAQRNQCCFNCLSTRHSRKACQSKHTCRQCQQKHHSLLHESETGNSNDQKSSGADPSTVEELATVNTHVASRISFSKTDILLATAWVTVTGTNGAKAVVRALLDQGSVTTVVSERLAQRLQLKRARVSVFIKGIGDAASFAKQVARIKVSPRDTANPALSVTALILKSLTTYVPHRLASITDADYLHTIKLADNDPTSSDPIDIIIGADLYGSLLRVGLRSRASNEPVAQNSIFGWILSGPMPTQSAFKTSIPIHHCAPMQSNMDAQLTRFWEIEKIAGQTHVSPEDIRCENHFASTHSRDAHGRYIVRLPFKAEPPLDLGDSRSIALAMYERSESRFKSCPDRATEYHAFLREYEQLGHMRKLSADLLASQQTVYIPHHAVIRDHSATTHLRVVFNASARTSNGSSLNDHLMIGPKLQADLPTILTRWRQFRYVYMADIAKMYRQILVDRRDLNYQRILWRSAFDGAIEDYQLLTVTYGTACAPYLALRVLRQLVLDEGANFPLAVPILQHHTYVDDCVFGADDLPLARATRNQLVSLLQTAGFQLRKWASNHLSLLADINPDDHGLAQSKPLKEDDSLKVLGIKWNPQADSFQFEVSLTNNVPSTKRAVLSTIASVFDPLGWISLVVITAKILLQKLWALRCDWDAELPDNLSASWHAFYTQLSSLTEISIPRWTGQGSDVSSAELHGFADASTVAYGAVVYLRLLHFDESVRITLLSSKSKVAPLKTITVPRLELCAAVLLVRLMVFMRSLLNDLTMTCHCWTDSTVTLAWLRQSPSRWRTFVANRVHEAQSQLPNAIWHHVVSPQNPADLVSRGVNPPDMKPLSLWWQGPEWLKLPSEQWPEKNCAPTDEVLPETRVAVSAHLAQAPSEWELATRFSSWTKLLRVTAYVIRFTHRLRSSPQQRVTNLAQIDQSLLALNPTEITAARQFWLTAIQRQLFFPEYTRLKDGQSVAKNSQLSALNPFLDSTGLIRVGGRLSHSELADKTKHPIVIASHPLVVNLIRHLHLQALHAGPQGTLTRLREEFWLLRARQTVRSVLYRCIVCTRESARVSHELMGQLPNCRVRPATHPFCYCGLDYAGPIQVRTLPGRGHTSRKAYIAVFICMTTKAAHLELVSDLSTSAFLAAFDRFCSRRGLPNSMYSDNATNFRGAQRELAELWRKTTRNFNVLQNLADRGITWKFIPPASPHFGGLWEACVRNVKYHLRRVVGTHSLTFEEMSTLLCKIEACLNSRPIGQLSDNYDDYFALTPSHFLIGDSLTSVPQPSLLDERENRLTRWQLISQMRDSFWKLWSQDYLHSLQQRPKWRTIQKLARVGRIVLLRNSLLPPCSWELGRIEECHPGNDELIRVVTVKTARSTHKRAITQLCFLPIDVNSVADNNGHPPDDTP